MLREVERSARVRRARGNDRPRNTAIIEFFGSVALLSRNFSALTATERKKIHGATQCERSAKRLVDSRGENLVGREKLLFRKIYLDVDRKEAGPTEKQGDW